MADGNPAHLPACWLKAEKQEIRETQVIKGLFEDARADVFSSWRNY